MHLTKKLFYQFFIILHYFCLLCNNEIKQRHMCIVELDFDRIITASQIFCEHRKATEKWLITTNLKSDVTWKRYATLIKSSKPLC